MGKLTVLSCRPPPSLTESLCAVYLRCTSTDMAAVPLGTLVITSTCLSLFPILDRQLHAHSPHAQELCLIIHIEAHAACAGLAAASVMLSISRHGMVVMDDLGTGSLHYN